MENKLKWLSQSFFFTNPMSHLQYLFIDNSDSFCWLRYSVVLSKTSAPLELINLTNCQILSTVNSSERFFNTSHITWLKVTTAILMQKKTFSSSTRISPLQPTPNDWSIGHDIIEHDSDHHKVQTTDSPTKPGSSIFLLSLWHEAFFTLILLVHVFV